MNCAKSKIDPLGFERCLHCTNGFTKSYDMTSCVLSKIDKCVWKSPWGCLECACGYATSYDLTSCIASPIEGCQRLTSDNSKCLQPKLGYTLEYTNPSGVFTYVAISIENGTFCGWRLSGTTTSCTKCQPGYYLEANTISCKKLSTHLQNEHAFYLTTNSLATPATAIEFIPGWESWTGKTSAGAFETPIANCATYDSTNYQYENTAHCTLCLQGYIPTQNLQLCVNGHPSCAFADDSTYLCAKCIDAKSYYIDESTNLCKIRAQMFDNCQDRDAAQDICLKCIPSTGTILDTTTKTCISIEGCNLSDGLTTCVTCDVLRFYDSAPTPPLCRPLPLNCAAATPPSTCTTCSTNYYIWSGVCYLKPPGCDTMDSSNAMQYNHFCTACLTGYHIVDTFCYEDIDFCTIYATTGRNACVTCQTMYVPSIDGSQCLHHNDEFQSECEKTDGQGNCLQCAGFKYIDQCLDIPNKHLCLLSNGLTNVCLQCYPNAILVNSICAAIESTCLRTDGISACKQCKPGYSINATTKRCDAISQCLISNGVNTTCLACNSGYILTPTGCVNKPTGCSVAVYSGSLTCLQCLSGYGLSGGACTVITNCASSSGTNMMCYQCNDNYQLSLTALSCSTFSPNPLLMPPSFCTVFNSQTISNILVYSPTSVYAPVSPNYGLCLNCQSPRLPMLRPDNSSPALITVLTQECVDTSSIATLINGCRIYGFIAGTCYKCQDKYHLSNSICVENTLTPYCLHSPGFASDGICSVCLEGVLLKSNQCVLAVENCTTYSTTNCTTCYSGFYLAPDFSSCTAYAGQQCATWNASFSTCLTCNSGFEYQSGNTCLYNPHGLNCATTSASNQCLTCSASNVMVRDSEGNPYCMTPASHADSNCRAYSSSGACTACATGFISVRTLNNDIYTKCTAKNAACTTATTTLCTSCSGSNYLDTSHATDGCVVVTNCISTAPGTGTGCTQCDTATGYAVNDYYSSAESAVAASFTCVKLANCVTSYNGLDAVCAVCSAMFYVNSSGQCVEFINAGCLASAGILPACTLCDDTYYLDSVSGICVLGLTSNCLKFSPLAAPTSSTVCAKCQSGYILDATTFSACRKLENCMTSDGSTTALCTKCDDMFYLDTSTNTCMKPYPFVAYCRRFADNSLTTCTECEIPFYLSAGACLPRTTRNDYCVEYSINKNVCTKCRTGSSGGGVIVYDKHFENVGFCRPDTIDFCATYQQNLQKCKICNQQPDYIEGWLENSANFCKDLTKSLCLTVNSTGTKCLTCQERINFMDAAGTACLKICTAATDFLGPGLLPTDPLVCTARTVTLTNCEFPHPRLEECLVCNVTYVWNPATVKCELMTVTGCADNGPTRGQTCIRCAPHHKLVSNACIALPHVANCASYLNNSNLCNICADGFYRSKDRTECIAVTAASTATCLLYALDEDRCLDCLDATYTISNDGMACFTGRATSHCIVSSTTSTTSACMQCEAGYIIERGQATCLLDVFNLPGCTAVAKVDGNTYYTCTACESDYNWRYGMCVPAGTLSTCLIEGCVVYSRRFFDSAQCSACLQVTDDVSGDKFQLVDQKCVFVPGQASHAAVHRSIISWIHITLIFIIVFSA